MTQPGFYYDLAQIVAKDKSVTDVNEPSHLDRLDFTIDNAVEECIVYCAYYFGGQEDQRNQEKALNRIGWALSICIPLWSGRTKTPYLPKDFMECDQINRKDISNESKIMYVSNNLFDDLTMRDYKRVIEDIFELCHIIGFNDWIQIKNATEKQM